MLYDRLIQLRREKLLSQEQLADRLHVSPQTVEAWETGQAVPDANEIVLLSEVFQISADMLLQGKAACKKAQPAGGAISFIVRSVFLMLTWISAFILFVAYIYSDLFSPLIELISLLLVLFSIILFVISLICEKRRVKKLSGQ